ncbi:MAG TPA: DMT family transporter [Holophagaceae bacterium]|jgi:drug/metabolite transporter (DMT)-like permease|nr:DMT family transporter [Holophagaceae bacterium]
MRAPRPGYVYALAAAGLFGASTPAAKWLLSSGGHLSPWLMAGILYLGSGTGLGLTRIVSRLRGHATKEAPLRGHDWGWLGATTLFGGVLGPVLLLEGLAHMAAGSASLLLNLEGVFTAGLAWFVFKEHFDRRIFLGMALILAGGVALSWAGGGLSAGRGSSLLIMGACFCWALDNNLTRRVSGSDALQIAMVKGLVAGTTNTVLALALGHVQASFFQWGIGGLIGFLGYGLSLLCFVLALRHIGTGRTGAYFSLAPFVGALIALGTGSEPLTARLMVSGGLMAAGVWLHLTEHHEHEHLHEALAHEHLHWHDGHHHHAHGADDPPGEPHSHRHQHEPLRHSHPHFPDLHHTHPHR